jgi:hypothetical protein
MDVEKESGINTESRNVPENGSGVQIENQRATTTALGEAAEIYGDVATAEELGYVHRGYVYP